MEGPHGPDPGCISGTLSSTTPTPVNGTGHQSRPRSARPSTWRGISRCRRRWRLLTWRFTRGLLDLAALEQYVLDRPCWQGVIQARRVAELAEPATESWMESVLRMTLIGGGLPRPRVQATLVSSAG